MTATGLNDPTVPCCGRDAADCDCPPDLVRNAAAVFLPMDRDDEGTLPCVVVAGVQVYVYVEEGRLVISADFDTSELGVVTPVVVRMSGTEVWSA